MKRAWKDGTVKSEKIMKSPLNLKFGQDGCLESDFATPNSKNHIAQIFPNEIRHI